MIEEEVKEEEEKKEIKIVEVAVVEEIEEEEEKVDDAISGFRRKDKKEEEETHDWIKIRKCHWAYKTFPMTTEVLDNADEFFFILPYVFATDATPEALERGLLETIEFRTDE